MDERDAIPDVGDEDVEDEDGDGEDLFGETLEECAFSIQVFKLVLDNMSDWLTRLIDVPMYQRDEPVRLRRRCTVGTK